MMTKEEKAKNAAMARVVYAKIKNVDKMAEAVEMQINKYKAEKHISKKGKLLVGLPSRNIGINKFLIETYKIEPPIAFKLVEMIGENTGKFKVGFAPFGSLLYLPDDYSGNSGVDFADLLK